MTPETPENPIQITDCIKTKLCLENYKENYPRWEREIFDVLRGHGLLEFFFATNLPSLPADSTTSVEFERWNTKDKVIWNWLFSTLPPDTRSNLGQLAHETTNLLWKSLRIMYSTDPLPSEFNLEDPPFIAKTSTSSSRTPENPTNPQISSTSENPIQINHPISIPLNEENYQENFPHWESEVLRIIGNLGLQDYLDGTIGHGERCKQGQLIWNWLWSSLLPTIVCELRCKPCKTASLLWKCLCSMYTTYYFPTVHKLKLQLQTIKKRNATCSEYLQQFNVIIAQLINAGCTLDEQQQVSYFLQGLGQEFEPFVTAVTTTSQTLTVTDILGRLFDEEKRLKRLFSLAQPPIVHSPGTASSNDIYFIGQNSSLFAGPAQYAPLAQPATYYSQPVTNACDGPRQPPTRFPATNNFGHLISNSERGRSNGNEIGWGQNFPPLTDGQYQCQICFKYGHTACYCLKYWQEFLPLSPSERQFLYSEAPINLTSVLNSSQFEDQWEREKGAGLFIYYLGSSVIYTPLKPLYHINYLQPDQFL